MQEHHEIFADGRWQQSESAQVVTLVNPATEEAFATAPDATGKDVEIAVAAARHAFEAGPWAAATPGERADAMERLAAALESRGERMARTVTEEIGMPITASRFNNVIGPAAILRYFAGLARGLAPEETRTAVTFPGRTVVRQEPVGVVAAIAPWNYPIGLTMSKLAPALAAGCTVVVKPAPETSLSAGILLDAVAAAGLPAGVVNLVTGGGRTGEALIRHPGVDMVAFTGATGTGRRIAAVCGEALKPVSLELGGKSAAIVLPDADLDAVLAGLEFLSFANTGQTCFAMTRVLTPRSRYDDVVDGLRQVADRQVVGDPADPATTMGPLASARQRDRVESFVAAGTADGARVVTGGRRPDTPGQGYYYAPTVFADVASSMGIAREEIFGPVVSVLPYRDEDEAVAIANDSEFGLAGTVWTADADHGLDVARRVETGTFGVNLYVPDLGSPWGGYKASGMGREYGPEGMHAYLKVKSIFLPGE